MGRHGRGEVVAWGGFFILVTLSGRRVVDKKQAGEGGKGWGKWLRGRWASFLVCPLLEVLSASTVKLLNLVRC